MHRARKPCVLHRLGVHELQDDDLSGFSTHSNKTGFAVQSKISVVRVARGGDRESRIQLCVGHKRLEITHNALHKKGKNTCSIL